MGCGASKSGNDVVTNNPGGRFEDYYRLMEAELGKGQFSTVKRAVEISTKREVAVKCIKKSEMTQEDIDALDIEKSVMRKLKGNRNLIQLYADFEDQEYHYLVMELARGGELFHKIVEREVYTEQQARDTVREITTAMLYCHQNGVVHRDLKPENVLIASATDETIKIADFGFAKELGTTADGLLHTACGTPGYVAPEILRQQPYGPSVDIWSLGVIFYILLCGYPPFHSDKGQDHLFKKIKHADFQFDSPDWDDISDDAKSLISNILVADPRKRLTAQQILEHDWMQKDRLNAANLSRARQNLVRFNARRKLKAAQKAVLTTVRMRRLLDGLRSAAESTSGSAAELDDAAKE